MRKKRFLASLIIIAMVLSTCFENIVPLSLANENTSQTYKLIFNAYNDFSIDENPNLPWKYQYRVMENNSYVYYDLEKDTREGKGNTWNTNDYAEITKTQGDLVTSTTNDVLNLSPWTDSHQAVLTFVAPYSGKINISMTNGGVFAPYSPETGVSFWLLQNEEIKVSKADLGYDDGYHNRFFSGIETLTVQEGDVIRFVIGRNASIDGRSYFNPEIQYTELENEKLLFNGYNDFSADENPNLPWKYQYRVMENSSYVYYDLEKDTRPGVVNTWNTNDYAQIAKTQGDLVTSTTNDVLNLSPWTDNHQAVLTFIAPYTGKINISMTNGGVFAPYSPETGVSFWLLQNDEIKVSKTDLGYDDGYHNRFFAETETLTVEEGDVIRFVIGRNASIDGRSFLNPQISYANIVKTTVVEETLEYNAYNDFSVNKNPNDVWSYLRLTNGTYVDMLASDGKWGKGAAGYIGVTSSDLVTGASVLELRPELPESDLVVRFTAPYSGTVDVSMANGGVFAPHQSKDEMAFTFKHNDNVVKSVADLDSSYNHSTSVGESYVGRFFADTVQLTVQAGDRLEFIVHRNIQIQDPRTYFNPQIVYKTRDNVVEEPINITAVAPVNNDEITIVSDSVLEWMTNYNIEETKFADYMGNGDTYYSGQVRLQWKANKRADSYIVKYGTDATLANAKSITTTQTLVEIDNFYADTDYYWQVVGAYEGGNVTSDIFKFSTAPTRRTVYMDGVSNTRDLGGIINSDGKTIKQGLVFRGANVDGITDEGKVQATSELGIKTDLDLRSQGETGSATESPIGASINYINVNAPQYDLIADYKENVKNIMQVFADEDNYPIYYHCQVGRDRTGTVAALLLGLLDVDKEQIYMDYEMSAFSKAGCLDGQEASVLRSQFDALYAYLETYGDDDFSNNVIRFLYDCGVTKEEISSIREIMLGDVGNVPEEVPTYNAHKDFSVEKNPNEVWSYQYRVLDNGKYVYSNLEKLNDKTWQTKTYAAIEKTQGDQVTSLTNDVLSVAAWDEEHQAVLNFTAPYDGIIEISMTNGGVFAPYNSADGVSFWMLQNDVVKMSKTNLDSDYNAEGNRFFAGTETLSVKTGDVIRFVVGRNTSLDGRTYFNPEIRYKELGSDVLSFPSDGEIVVSDIKTNGFTITWPSAVGGSGNYTYKVYCSKTPFTGIPSEGGREVTGNSYTFKDLTFRESYYVAVVVDDGENRIALNAVDAIKVFSDMFVFDAYQDFSKGTQNAAWQYLYTPIGKLQTTALEWNKTQWGDEVLGSVTLVEKDPVVGTEALCVTPGVDTDVAVAFVAPYTGTIKVSSSNGGIYVPANGAGDDYDGINFAMKLNNTVKAQFKEVSAKNMHPASVDASLFVGRVFTEAYVMDVTEGDVLYFIVNKNTNLHNDSTYFNPNVEYTAVDASTLGLHFGGRKKITATDITKSTLTVNWPEAFGGTGKYSYTLYISDRAITKIPTKGGIKMGEKTSYSMKDLSPYTSYYFAVVASDGKDSVSLISKEAISTIGNTYTFDAVEDYTEKMQPISTPWRYYWQDTKTGKLTELEWNNEKKQYGSDLTVSLSQVTSDMVTGKEAFMVHPQMGKNVVVGFIAPFSGKITIDMTNGGVFAPYNGQAQNWDGVNFTLKKNEQIVYGKEKISSNNSHMDRCFASSVSLEVKEGDVIYFIVNCNKDVAADATYLAPKVNYTFVEKNSDQFGFLPGATVKATDVENSSFTLNWSAAFNPNKEAISYKVWISTQPIKKQPTSKPIYSGKNLSTVCTGLKYATKYYVYVVATTASENTDVLNPNAAVVTACPVYDAYKQYSTEKNEAQVWNYAIRVYNEETEEYEYKLLEYDEKAKSWGNSEIGMLSTVDKNPVTGLPSMYAHPGANNNDAALAFTAPYSGTIRISMNNGGIFAPHNGKEQNYDGISFFAYSSEKELWTLENVSSKHNAEGTRLGQNVVEITVKQGDRLYFVVHANKNSAADSTYFNPFIEYVEVTGGTGEITELKGFVEPEPEKVYPASFRENEVAETNGLAVVLKQLSAGVSAWIWIAIYSAAVLAILVAIAICLKKLKKIKN